MAVSVEQVQQQVVSTCVLLAVVGKRRTSTFTWLWPIFYRNTSNMSALPGEDIFVSRGGGGSREGAPVFFWQLSGRRGPVRSNGCDQLSTETSAVCQLCQWRIFLNVEGVGIAGSREGASVFCWQWSGRGEPIHSHGCGQLSTETPAICQLCQGRIFL